MSDDHNGREPHTVRSFDDELGRLATLVARMGALASSQLSAALQALIAGDENMARRVAAADPILDALEADVHSFTIRLLALRQPVAQDLRSIVAALKISGELERVGDYAANIAKRVATLAAAPQVGKLSDIRCVAAPVQQMIRDALEAYVERDTAKARAVWERDEEVDALYAVLVRALTTDIIADPRNVTAAIHLMFVAKNIERIGDHATNIAETIIYQETGAKPSKERPKGRETPPTSL